jgi:DNA-binding response OmpR family regulator
MNTVIVVDDDKTFTGLLKTILELEGYQAVVVSNPDDVVATTHQVKPVLVLMDVHTGRGDTLSVLRELKTDEALKTVPVVMDSGMDRAEECLAAGAEAFLLKPFRPSELLATVAGLISKEDKDV